MALFPETATPDAKRLIWAKGVRALADGCVSVLLPAYLLLLGYDSFEIGMLTTATLLGSAVLTLLTGMMVPRFGHRQPLLAATGLMIATGLGFATVEAFWPLLVIAFVGTLNPSTSDVSLFLPLEHSLLSQSVSEKERTALFVRYSLAGAGMGAFGTLLAAVPDIVLAPLGITPIRAIQAMFLLYAGIGVAAGFLYLSLSGHPRTARPPSQPLGPSKRIIYKLTALFCVDAFGGGFLVQTILALWLFKTFNPCHPSVSERSVLTVRNGV